MKLKYYLHAITITFLLFITSLKGVYAETKIEGEIIAGGLLLIETLPDTILELEGEIVPISNSGHGLIGFTRKPKNIQNLKIIYPDGRIEGIKFKIKERSYKIQRIDGLEQKKVEPSEELLDRIYEERIRVKKSRKEANLIKTPFYLNGLIMPATGPITGIYGSQRILNGIAKNPHYGIDIALPEGHSVLAPMDGIIVFTDNDLFYSGGTIIISHGQGLTSSYLHLSKILVKKNQKINKGDLIAEIGSTGRATGPHLHWGFEWMGKRIDPEYVVKLFN